jgi:hypothetical protein
VRTIGRRHHTRIEAVSNNVTALREPIVRHRQADHVPTAASLAFTAGSIILLYLLGAGGRRPRRQCSWCSAAS